MARTVTGAGRGGNRQQLRSVPAQASADGLPDGGWQAWERRLLELGTGWLADSDAPLVRQTARAIARRDALGELLDEIGPAGWFTEMDSGRTFPHAGWSVMAQLEAQVTSWLGLLGFTPRDRAQLKLDQDDAAKAAAELRALRGSRAS
jgi:hypothetical protein